jgi:hypothetical protein
MGSQNAPHFVIPLSPLRPNAEQNPQQCGFCVFRPCNLSRAGLDQNFILSDVVENAEIAICLILKV